MAKGDKYTLKNDVRGSKGNLYGKKGAEVKEISFSEPVIIVEDKNGERFPVHIQSLTKNLINGK